MQPASPASRSASVPRADHPAAPATPPPDERLRRVREAAEQTDHEAVDVLIAALTDPDFRVRRDAAAALTERHSRVRDVLPELTALLDDEVAIVRHHARTAIVRAGTQEASETIASHALVAPEDELDGWWAACVEARAVACVPQMERHLIADDPYLRERSALRLAAFEPEGRDVLIERVRSLPATAPIDAERICSWLPALAAADALDDDARHAIAEVAAIDSEATTPTGRVCALAAHARAGDDVAWRDLTTLLRTEPSDLTAPLLRASEGWMDPRLAELLVSRIEAPNETTLEDPAAVRLTQMGPAGLDAARGAFPQSENARQYGLAVVLLRIGDPDDHARVDRWLATQPDSELRRGLQRLRARPE